MIWVVMLVVLLDAETAKGQHVSFEGPDRYQRLLKKFVPIEIADSLREYLDTVGDNIEPFVDDGMNDGRMIVIASVSVRTDGTVRRVSVIPELQGSVRMSTDTTHWAWRSAMTSVKEAISQWKYHSIEDPNYVGPLTLGYLLDNVPVVPRLLVIGEASAHLQHLFVYRYVIVIGEPIFTTIEYINVKP
jgi:hypothetical protein